MVWYDCCKVDPNQEAENALGLIPIRWELVTSAVEGKICSEWHRAFHEGSEGCLKTNINIACFVTCSFYSLWALGSMALCRSWRKATETWKVHKKNAELVGNPRTVCPSLSKGDDFHEAICCIQFVFALTKNWVFSYLSRIIYVSYFCFLPSYRNVEMERIGRKVEFFTWDLQPKRGQHIGGILLIEGEELLTTISCNDILLAWND